MIKLKNFKTEISFIICVLIFSGIFYYSGCNSSTTGPNNNSNTVDTNIAKFDSISIYQYNGLTTSNSAADIYAGLTLADNNKDRDINMRDSANNPLNPKSFYFVSGDQFSPAGYTCKFRNLNYNLTKANFDTITVIPVGHDSLTDADFPDLQTKSYGYFNASENQGSVYAFYLKGRSAVIGHTVFGVLFLKEATGGGELVPFSETISVKFNKYGHNKLK